RKPFRLSGLMVTQLNIYVIFMTLFHLYVSVMTREINIINTTEPIGCNGLPYQNINHTKLYYEVTSYSQVELPSCDNGRIDFLTFWFVIDDLC
ncbi:unnamed protein product, partial [Adineta steineri]